MVVAVRPQRACRRILRAATIHPVCPHTGGEHPDNSAALTTLGGSSPHGWVKIIAAILERPVIEKIPSHLGPDPQPPPGGRARAAAHD